MKPIKLVIKAKTAHEGFMDLKRDAEDLIRLKGEIWRGLTIACKKNFICFEVPEDHSPRTYMEHLLFGGHKEISSTRSQKVGCILIQTHYDGDGIYVFFGWLPS